MEKEQTILVLDFGTSNVRAVLVGIETGRIFCKISSHNQWIHPQPGWSEMDPELLWENAQRVVESIFQKNPGQYEILGIGCSFFGDSLILTDEQLNPLYNMVMAFDRRAYKEAKEIEQFTGREEFSQMVGGPPLSMLVCSKLLWFRKNKPELFHKTKYFLNIQEYILGKLGLGLWTDYTLAGRKTMLDIRTKEWAGKLLKVTGTRPDQMGGSIADSVRIIGMISRFGRIKLPMKLKVVLGAHDSECGFLGLGIVPGREGVIGNVSGTYEMLGYFTKGLNNRAEGGWETGCGLKKNQMTVSGSSIAGDYVTWFRREIGKNREGFFRDMEKNISYNGKKSIFFLTSHDSDLCVFDGFSVNTSEAELYQAIMEGITFKLKDLVEEIDGSKKEKTNCIMAGGGGASSDKWLQFKADLFHKKVCKVANQEVSALGAAMIAAVGLGIYQDFGRAAENMVQTGKIFLPEKEASLRYQEKYRKYCGKLKIFMQE